MDIGTRSIADLVDGAMRVSLKHSMNISMRQANSRRSLWILQSCGPILRRRGPEKKGGQDAPALGRTRGGFTTKLHLSLSDDWVPLRWLLTSGNRNDITQAAALIQGYSYKSVIGDKAYDSDAFREAIVSGGGVAVIPPRESRTDPRPYDEELYKRRNIIERFFHRLK